MDKEELATPRRNKTASQQMRSLISLTMTKRLMEMSSFMPISLVKVKRAVILIFGEGEDE